MSIYTTIQLFLEFFIGCALFMTAGDLVGKYSKSSEILNEDYLNRQNYIKKLEAETQITKKSLLSKKARLLAIDQALKLYISDQIAVYHQLCAQSA